MSKPACADCSHFVHNVCKLYPARVISEGTCKDFITPRDKCDRKLECSDSVFYKIVPEEGGEE